MDENKILNDRPSDQLKIDPERLNYISGIIKKSIIELNIAKKKADDAWNSCYTSLGDTVTKDINERKYLIDKKYEEAISNLENEANNLMSIATIWNETESQIMSSSKQIDDMFTKLNETMSFFSNNSNKQ